MNFDILIPTQESIVAKEIIDYVVEVVPMDLPEAKRVAVALVDMKYWEAYDCGDAERQEYWRMVKIELDVFLL